MRNGTNGNGSTPSRRDLAARAERVEREIVEEAQRRAESKEVDERALRNIGSLMRRGRSLGVSVMRMTELADVSRSTAYVLMEKAEEDLKARIDGAVPVESPSFKRRQRDALPPAPSNGAIDPLAALAQQSLGQG